MMIENFEQEIKDGLVLLDFYATWCGPCKMMHPIIDGIINTYSDVKVIKIDVDMNQDLARSYSIMSIPTLMLLKDGELVEKNIGFTSSDVITNWINQHK